MATTKKSSTFSCHHPAADKACDAISEVFLEERRDRDLFVEAFPHQKPPVLKLQQRSQAAAGRVRDVQRVFATFRGTYSLAALGKAISFLSALAIQGENDPEDAIGRICRAEASRQVGEFLLVLDEIEAQIQDARDRTPTIRKGLDPLRIYHPERRSCTVRVADYLARDWRGELQSCVTLNGGA